MKYASAYISVAIFIFIIIGRVVREKIELFESDQNGVIV